MSSTSSNDIDTLISDRASERDVAASDGGLHSVLTHYFPEGTLAILDRDLRILMIAGKELEEFGLSPEMLLGKTITDLAPLDFAAELIANYRLALSGKEVKFNVDYRDRYYSITATPLLGENDQISSILVLTQNATKKKATGQAVKKNENLMRAIRDTTELLSSGSNPTQACANLLQTAGPAFIADCMYIVCFSENEADYPSYTIEWEPNFGITQKITSPLFTRFLERHREHFAAHNILSGILHTFSGQDRTELAERNSETILIVPIFLQETLWGCIGIDNRRYAKPWSAHEEQTLTTLAHTLGNYLHRISAEQTSRNNETRIERAEACSPVLMAHLATDGTWLKVPQKLCELLGYTATELLAMNVDTITHPEDLETSRRERERLLRREQQSYEIEKRYICRDGSFLWVSLSCSLVTDEKDTPLYLLGYIYDITQRKNAEEQLRKNEEFFRLVLRAANDGVWDWDMSTGVISSSSRMQEMLGYDKSTFPDTSDAFFNLIHPDDIANVKVILNSHLDTGTAYMHTSRFLHRDGTVRWLICRGSALYNALGIPYRMVGTCTDITGSKLQEELLLQSERRFRSLIQNSSDVTTILDENANILYQSPAFIEIFGMTTETTGTSFYTLLHPDAIQSFRECFDESLRIAGVPFKREYQFCRNDGSSVFLESVLTNRLDDPSVSGIVVNSRDITERREAERKIRESGAMLMSVIESTGDSVFALDREYRYITCNSSHQTMMRSLYGTGPILPGQTLASYMIIPSHAKAFTELVDRALQGEQFICEIPYPTDNDQNVDYKELTLNPIHSDNGDITGVAIFARNITEKKRSEERIRNSELLLKSINANISEGLYRSTADNRLIYANQAFADLFGFSSVEEALSATSPMLYTDATQQQHLKDLIEQEGKFSNQEVQFIRRDGSLFWALVSSRQEHDDKGNLFYDGAITDITDRMQVQEALSRSYEQLEVRVQERTADLQHALEQLNIVLAKEKELSELKTRFVSMVSHEFRTPLTSILSSVEILDRYWQRLDETRIQRFHYMIKESVAHMSSLLDDVILLGKAEAGRLLFRPVALDPVAFCHDLIEQMQSGAFTNREIHFFTKGIAREVQLDPTLLRHIITNLLINAIKYSDIQKPVSLSLTIEDKEIVLEIADQGIGIATEDLEHIFDPFYRSKQVETIPGTGLGLSIVKQSVERHGGAINTQSEVNKGTVFTVRLPVS